MIDVVMYVVLGAVLGTVGGLFGIGGAAQADSVVLRFADRREAGFGRLLGA